ncbi:MAG: hypothetical protein ABI843_09425 [Dokdonella sp.]
MVVGPSCPYSNLQDAINHVTAADSSIDITQDYSDGPVHIDAATVQITGGVASCADTAIVSRSKLDGRQGDGSPGAVIELTGSAQPDLRNF